MISKKCEIVLVVTTLCISLMTFVTGDRIFADENFVNVMVHSRDLMTRNPIRSADCFNQYIQSIDEIAKAYQRNHDACIQTSRDDRSQAEAATLDDRNKLASSATSSCNVLNQCSEIESAEEVFECYVAGGSTNSRILYALSGDASEYLSDLREQFRLVENREYKCTNDTKRQYERDTVQAYDKFNNCNLGITEAPVETEPTEQPEVSESTENPEVTEAPVETEPTEQSEVPESTENPEVTESTEQPENPENNEDNVESKLPEEDLSLRRRLKSRLSKIRFLV